MADKLPFISFPERYLGARPMKFPLVANNEGYFAFSKPAGIASFRHDWTEGLPDVSMALRRELLNEKPQLKKLGVEGLFRIYGLDAEISGILLYAKTLEWEEILKNALGSGQIVFRYHFLASNKGDQNERYCDLPLARHTSIAKMLVSHKTGKKCATRFRYLRNFGRYELWEAESRDIRMHQIRLHAAEEGLLVVGESLYGQGDEIFLSSLKRGFRQTTGRELPLYDQLCLHLVSIGFDLPGKSLSEINAPLPSGFSTLLRKLDQYKGRRGWAH